MDKTQEGWLDVDQLARELGLDEKGAARLRAEYEAHELRLKPVLDGIMACTKLTTKDFAITINARG